MSENVAIPATAFTDVVPDSAAPVGLLPNDNCTVPVKPVTTLPIESSAATVIGGVRTAPPVEPFSVTVNASFVAEPTVMSNTLDVAVVSAPLDATSV